MQNLSEDDLGQSILSCGPIVKSSALSAAEVCITGLILLALLKEKEESHLSSDSSFSFKPYFIVDESEVHIVTDKGNIGLIQ